MRRDAEREVPELAPGMPTFRRDRAAWIMFLISIPLFICMIVAIFVFARTGQPEFLRMTLAAAMAFAACGIGIGLARSFGVRPIPREKKS
jgi:hypothetical protein